MLLVLANSHMKKKMENTELSRWHRLGAQLAPHVLEGVSSFFSDEMESIPGLPAKFHAFTNDNQDIVIQYDPVLSDEALSFAVTEVVSSFSDTLREGHRETFSWKWEEGVFKAYQANRIDATQLGIFMGEGAANRFPQETRQAQETPAQRAYQRLEASLGGTMVAQRQALLDLIIDFCLPVPSAREMSQPTVGLD